MDVVLGVEREMHMIGLGKWEINVNTRFYSGDVLLVIAEKDGAYDIYAEFPGGKRPDFQFSGLRAQGNTITGVARHSLLQGSQIPLRLTFEDDTVSGSLDVPFLGMIEFSKGGKVG